MADLDQIFPDHGDAEHADLEYLPGETLEIAGSAPDYQRVIVQIVALKVESTYAQVAQETTDGEYSFVLRPEYTGVFPDNSTVEDPALAYEIRGENEGGPGSKSLKVGWLVTAPEPKF